MKKCHSIFLLPTLLLWSVAVYAQAPDSISTTQETEIQLDTVLLPSSDLDTAQSETNLDKPKKGGFAYRLLKEDYPNPNKALVLSLAIPGGGQMYNRRWWKVPIVYAGYAALIYSARFNGSNYRDLRDAVISEYEDPTKTHKFSHLRLSVSDLERLRNQFDKRKQLSYIGIFALHLVQTAEAFVDCHLKTFDVSDDLSLKVKPSLQAVPQSYGLAPGVGIALTIK